MPDDLTVLCAAVVPISYTTHCICSTVSIYTTRAVSLLISDTRRNRGYSTASPYLYSHERGPDEGANISWLSASLGTTRDDDACTQTKLRA